MPFNKPNRRAIITALGVAAITSGCDQQWQQRISKILHSNKIKVLLFDIKDEVEEIYRHRHNFYLEYNIVNEIEKKKYDDIHNIISNNIEEYDVIYVDDIWMAEFASKKMLTNISGYVKRHIEDMDGDYTEQILDDMARTKRGEIWMVPQRADVQVLYYNKEIFEDKKLMKEYHDKYHVDLKPPLTWDEYYRIAKYLHNKPFGKGKIVGTLETLKATHYAFEFFACRYWNKGTFFDNELDPKRSTFDNDDLYSTIRSMRACINNSADPRSLDLEHTGRPNDPPGSVDLFKRGMTAMMPQWYSFYSELSSGDNQLGSNCGVALLPGSWVGDQIKHTPCLGGGSLAIPASSQKTPFAFEFIRYFTGPEFSRHAAIDDLITPRNSAYQKDGSPGTPVHTYRSSIRQAHARPRYYRFTKLEELIGQAIHDCLTTDDERRWNDWISKATILCDQILQQSLKA